MIQCNGASIKSIELKEFRYRNSITYDNLCMLDVEVSTGFLYNNEIISFDRMKPTDFYKNLPHFSLLYLWNICIDGYLFSGRTLEDLLDFLETLNERLEGTFFIYIHNASYEFQFMRNILDGVTVFARKTRKPIKFNWKNIEFRCSYMLTRLSLDTWAREKNLSVKKLTGMYDYNTLRTPYTSLTVLERDYGYNDVLVGVCGLQEYLERYKHVKNIPLTQTSCIRKNVQKIMRDDYKSRKKMSAMTEISFDDYLFLVKCFVGGYTHANILYSGLVVDSLWDFDISSSYPWAMLSEKYPCSQFVESKNTIRYMENTDKYCYAMRVRLYNVESMYFNTYISISKCEETEGVLLDNGRVISAKMLTICLLDVDWRIVERAYHYERCEVLNFYFALKSYLPDSFRKYLVTLYNNKTTLKGDAEKFDLYFKSKEEINGCYGMGVTKDITDEIMFDGDWYKELLTVDRYYEKRDRKVKNLSKFTMAYAQGIYVPAYGRQNLWHMVHLFDDEIVYMDTDSIKTVDDEAILKAVNEYNENVHNKQREIACDLGISFEDFNPRDSNGEAHSIGIYERDKDINRFKTLGAKRYICEYIDKYGVPQLKMTVSGVRKKAVQQLNDIEEFTDDLTFTVDNAEKLMLIYDDEQEPIIWNRGKPDEFFSNYKYGIASYNVPFSMKVSDYYLSVMAQMRDEVTSIFKMRGVE